MKRFALFLATKDSEYVIKYYNGYFNVFVNAFGEEDDVWDLFRVFEDEFPNMEDLKKFDGFIVSGSPHDAYGNDLWVIKLCFLLQTLDAMEKKILGICFGHQVICRALGGRVAKSAKGWDIGIREVCLANDLSHYKFFDEMQEIPKYAPIIEIHQDEVWEVPLGAEVLASSDHTNIELFCIGGHILGIQGHPEYNKDILQNLIDRLHNNNSITSGFADEIKTSIETVEPNSKFWQKICKVFLHRD